MCYREDNFTWKLRQHLRGRVLEFPLLMAETHRDVRTSQNYIQQAAASAADPKILKILKIRNFRNFEGCLKILKVVSKSTENPRGSRKIDRKLEKHHKNDGF